MYAIKTTLLLLALLLVTPFQAFATAYYVDFSLTTAGGNGLATTTAFANLNQFANVARSAGDIAFVRRGTASTTNVTSATLTSDGTLNNPIIVTADYDGLWPQDHSTSSQTYTVTFGSLTMTADATITGISAGDWIYVQDDCYSRYQNLSAVPTSPTVNNCEFAYEVKTVSGTTLTLYLPYKGNQSGSGFSLHVMQDAPIVGTVSTNTNIISMSSDDYWVFKGVEFRGTPSSGVVLVTSTKGLTLYDVVIQANGSTDVGIGGGTKATVVRKTRIYNGSTMVGFSSGGGIDIKDFLFDCNSVASAAGLSNPTSDGTSYVVRDGQIQNCAFDFSGSSFSVSGVEYFFSNVKRTGLVNAVSGAGSASYFFQDDFGTVGLNSQSSNQISSNTVSTTTQATTTNLRSGGGPINLVVFPPSGSGNTGISTYNFPASYIKLFDYPIYTDTSSRTYTMYFNATSTTAWTVNPLTATATGSSTPELFIECEYYNDSTDADRIVKRSNTANDVDFDGSTAWQDISVTCQPSQTGILYLRGWYGKPKESGSSNWFYMDTTPVVN